MKKFICTVALIATIISPHCHAQAVQPDTRKESGTADPGFSSGVKKGSFFITPYYLYGKFEKLKLISNTNTYKVQEGTHSYDFTSDDISEYNDNYKTDYSVSMVALRIGYQALEGLGVSAFIGVNHYYFRSWISDENTQSVSTLYPALSFGGAVDYEKELTKHLLILGFASVTYTTTSKVATDNSSGEDVIDSHLKWLYWDVNVGLSYKIKKWLPYGGVGFTQQFIHPVSTEQIETKDNQGNVFYNETTFDSHFRGEAFYGFAGLEFRMVQYLSLYGRCTFVNPLWVTAGLRVIL